MDQIIRGVRLRGREGSFDVAIEGDADRELDGEDCLLSPASSTSTSTSTSACSAR